MKIKERILLDNEKIRHSFEFSLQFSFSSTESRIFMLDVSNVDRLIFWSNQPNHMEAVVYDNVAYADEKSGDVPFDYARNPVTLNRNERLLAFQWQSMEWKNVETLEDKSNLHMYTISGSSPGEVTPTITSGKYALNRVTQYKSNYLYFDQPVTSSKYLFLETNVPDGALFNVMGVKDESAS